MNTFKNLPRDNPAQPIQDAAELAFEQFIRQNHTLFSLSRPDRSDYGSDYQIEAKDGEYRTNLRSHVQLKGSNNIPNTDDSISITIDVSNLNYLIHQPRSIYVCFSLKQNKLLARPADEVYRQYMKSGKNWEDQNSLTVKFTQALDMDYLKKIHRIVLDTGRGELTQRLDWAASPPEKLTAQLKLSSRTIEVPLERSEAIARLNELYAAGEDLAISRAFDQFSAVLGDLPAALTHLYMAEINLAINHQEFQQSRIENGIKHLQNELATGHQSKGGAHYSLGNAFLALQKYTSAIEHFDIGIALSTETRNLSVAAQALKNRGSALEKLGKPLEARESYERALGLDPDLAEARFALAHWHSEQGADLHASIMHLDAISIGRGSALTMASVEAQRAKAHFLLDDHSSAFRAINNLIGNGAIAYDWKWGSSAQLVAQHGRKSLPAMRASYTFWRRFLEHHPDEHVANAEKFLCAWGIHHEGEQAPLTYEEFCEIGIQLTNVHVLEEAFILDKIGHWAQDDNRWQLAETWFRQAYTKNPNTYGCCLGVALNHLGRHEDALEPLLRHISSHNSDPVAHFNLAYAQDMLGLTTEAIASYETVIEVDEMYDLAWFNLSAAYAKQGLVLEALYYLKQATVRFPNHPQTREALEYFASLETSPQK